MPGCVQVWHQYPLRSPKRDQLKEWLDQCGIATDIHYAVPPHRQPCYSDTHTGLFWRLYPLTDRIAGQLLSLPIADLNDAEAAEVAEAVNAFSL